MKNNTKTGRIEYFDTARAFLIFLVVLGHVLIVLNPGYDRLLLTAAQEFMASFYMPGFLIIHGILVGNKWGGSVPVGGMLLARRARALLIPYLFFETIGILCRWMVYGQSLSTGLYNLLTIRCNVGADWFLPALFMGNLLCTFWGMRQKRFVQAVSVCLAILLPMLLPDNQFCTVIGRGLLAYSFIMVGTLLRDLFVSEEMPGWGKTVLSLLVTGVCSIVNLKWGTNDFYSCTVGNPLTLVLAGISGTYLTLAVARRFTHPVISKTGAQSLVIMGTHQLVIYVMTALVPGMRGGSLLWGAGLLAVIIVFEIVMIFVLNRYFPHFIGKGARSFTKGVSP